MVHSARSPYSFLSSSIATKTCGLALVDECSRLDMSAYQLGPNWFFNGIPMFSEEGIRWLSTRTDQNVKLADFLVPIADLNPLSLIESFSEICHMPDQDETRRALDGIFKSPSRLTFPVLDKDSLETTMHIAYEPLNEDTKLTTQLAARACVLASLSITAWPNASHKSYRNIDPEICAAKAEILLVNLTENISLDTLQAIILLVSITHCARSRL